MEANFRYDWTIIGKISNFLNQFLISTKKLKSKKYQIGIAHPVMLIVRFVGMHRHPSLHVVFRIRTDLAAGSSWKKSSAPLSLQKFRRKLRIFTWMAFRQFCRSAGLKVLQQISWPLSTLQTQRLQAPFREIKTRSTHQAVAISCVIALLCGMRQGCLCLSPIICISDQRMHI